MLKVLIDYILIRPEPFDFSRIESCKIPELLNFPQNYFINSRLRNKKILGRLLMIQTAEKLNPKLNKKEIHYTPMGKPVFPKVSVSLSYSNDIIVAAACRNGIIGVDVEKIAPVKLSHYFSCFTQREREYIQLSLLKTEAFYCLWTKKESVLKANGIGLSEEMVNIEVIKNRVNFSGKKEKFSIFTIKLLNKYILSLAVNSNKAKIEMNEIVPNNIVLFQ